jgi:hypothetical protein
MRAPTPPDAGNGEVEYALAAGVLVMAVVLLVLSTPLEERLARFLGF